MNCPSCKSTHVKKNGHIHNGSKIFAVKTVADNLSLIKIKKRFQTTTNRLSKICYRNAFLSGEFAVR